MHQATSPAADVFSVTGIQSAVRCALAKLEHLTVDHCEEALCSLQQSRYSPRTW